MKTKLFAACALVLMAGAAQANTYQMQFTAVGFTTVSDLTGGPPADPVSGSIVYTADGPDGAMTAIDSISLSIAGHAYSVGEVGYLYVGTNTNSGRSFAMVGGLLNGPDWLYPNTDDFWIVYYTDSLTGSNLYYNIGSQRAQWGTWQFSDFSVTELQTPLPAALPMFATGLGMFYAALRCRKKIRRRRLSAGTNSGGGRSSLRSPPSTVASASQIGSSVC